jgi:ketosteroid isomerase-like protein
MTPNRTTVDTFMDGFRTTDRAQILSCLTDDVEWNVPGAFDAKGKEAFATHIVDPGFAAHPAITVTRTIEGNDVVVAQGRVSAPRTDGSVLNLAFCDVFEMRAGLIRRLTSYLVQVR